MCGIAGIVRTRGDAPTLDVLRRMCDTIEHRGPDDEGTWCEGAVALGMRRLSIIDVAGGQQPVFNEDRSIVAVFNGEIYNFRELRRELEADGHRFRSDSDSEIIPHAYEAWGEGFADRLNGMFAIALYDIARGRIVLARDHIGIKPLYWFHDANGLVFGSEIKVLLASGAVPRTLNVDAAGQFMAWEYVPCPETLFAGVYKLPPGEQIVLDVATGERRQYAFWQLALGEETRSPADWEDAVDAQLAASVRMQMVSDVPLGAFLSGGVDSSLIVAAMGEANTFSIGFDDPSYNELAYSTEVAEHLGVSHVTEVVRPDVVQHFEHLMRFMDDPIGDFSIFPTFLVSRLARQHVTVALSGDGGDELFGGYDTYVAELMAQRYQRLPGWLRGGLIEPVAGLLPPQEQKKGLINKVRRFAEGASHAPRMRHARWRLFTHDALRGALFTESAAASMTRPAADHILALDDQAADADAVNRLLFIDLKSYLADNILVKVDRMSMAVSLETRVPFLDKDLVELAFRIPQSQKVDGAQTKVLLKRVAARHIPRHCAYRQKEGFSIPIKTWLGTQFRPVMDDLLHADRLRAGGLFRVETVERLKREHLSNRANHSHVLWSMMIFEAWRRMWLDG